MSTLRIAEGGGIVAQGDCLRVLARLPAESVDAVITDPPYGLHFQGAEWDTFSDKRHNSAGRKSLSEGYVGGPATVAGLYDSRRNAEYGRFIQRVARALFRVMKPGAHLAMCGAPRRFHWQGVALELAGFELRDTLCWLFGQGFPKSHNLTGAWDGWGTALKPGWEPILLSRKPFRGTVAANVQRHGTGAIHVDGGRIPPASEADVESQRRVIGFNMSYSHGEGSVSLSGGVDGSLHRRDRADFDPTRGRWPANVALAEAAAALLDAQAGEHPGATSNSRNGTGAFDPGGHDKRPGPGDSGGASRFFYVAKAHRGEREAGLREAGGRTGVLGDGLGGSPHVNGRRPGAVHNDHPTVKPVELMRWLVRLLAPPGGLVLDPFAGSGTTGVACAVEGARSGVRFLGIEQVPRYVAISRARIAHWSTVEAPRILAEEDSEARQAALAEAQTDLLEGITP